MRSGSAEPAREQRLHHRARRLALQDDAPAVDVGRQVALELERDAQARVQIVEFLAILPLVDVVLALERDLAAPPARR